MYSIIFAVVAIALFAALTTATMKYVPIDAIMKFQTFNVLSAGLDSMQGSVVRYLDDHRDVDGKVIYPTAADITSDVTPVYGFLPSAKPGFAWAIKPGSVYGQQAIGICLAPASAEAEAQAPTVMPLLKTHLPQGSSVIGAECNSTSESPGGSVLTYWVMLNHLD